ncbi:MAG: sulfatase-like hydrolase/transferase [Verrucomicrobiota bacterium]
MAVHHKSGGVGELSDYWGNNYFDDVYFVNNEPKQFEGYCTDIWFEEAMKSIGEVREQPFFVYIPTNAPHGPLYVSDQYAEPYRDLVGERIFSAEFYGMITNIDENFGKLEAYLQKEGLADNTLLIFSTDNGTGAGMSRNGLLGYNHGLRGKKGHRTEGGHRVPFFVRWKDGKLDGGRDVDEVAAHVDVLPTLVKLCGLKMPEDMEVDGVDLSPLLIGEARALPIREVFVHNRQDWRPPTDVDASCIIRGKWRLVDRSELYDVAEDRMQRKNLASQYPEVVSEMLKSNAQFVASAKLNTEYAEFPASVIGSEHQAEVKLTIQHAIGEDAGFWKCEQVAAGLKSRNNTHSIEIEREGVYRISFRRWPIECSGPIRGIPEKNPKGGMFDYKAISPEKARLSIVNQVWEKPVGESEHEIVFEINLEPGKTFLVNDFIEGREAYGVYYTYVQYLGE